MGSFRDEHLRALLQADCRLDSFFRREIYVYISAKKRVREIKMRDWREMSSYQKVKNENFTLSL